MARSDLGRRASRATEWGKRGRLTTEGVDRDEDMGDVGLGERQGTNISPSAAQRPSLRPGGRDEAGGGEGRARARRAGVHPVSWWLTRWPLPRGRDVQGPAPSSCQPSTLDQPAPEECSTLCLGAVRRRGNGGRERAPASPFLSYRPSSPSPPLPLRNATLLGLARRRRAGKNWECS